MASFAEVIADMVWGSKPPEGPAWPKRSRIDPRIDHLRAGPERAHALLMEYSSPAQRETIPHGFLRVETTGYRYYIRTGGSVYTMDRNNPQFYYYLCVHALQDLPGADEALVMKLAIELDEPRFLYLANRINTFRRDPSSTYFVPDVPF
jgi:hypothetical protein